MDQNLQQIKVNFTEEDRVDCTCGSKLFTQVHAIMKKKNPMIGEPDIVGVAQVGVVCVSCGEDPFAVKDPKE